MNTKLRRISVIILLIIIVTCALCALLVPARKVNSFALQGSGTEDDPYLITGVEDLKAFRDQVNGGNAYQGKHVSLTCDLDLQCKLFEPIGNDAAKPFKGIFDGNGHTIDNFYLKKVSSASGAASEQLAAGFFGYVTNGEVKNLNFDNYYINFYSAAGSAATASKAAGTIPTIMGGAAVGLATNSKISGINVVGGVDVISGNGGAGYATTSTTYNKGGAGGMAFAGGVVGYLDAGSQVSDCSFTGNVYGYGGTGGNGGAPSSGSGGAGGDGGYAHAGGIVGMANTNTQVMRCCANAEILVRGGVGGSGGLGAGASNSGGAAGAGGYMRGGGIVGTMRGILLSDCFATGNINLWNPVNGVPGYNNSTTTLTSANSARNGSTAGGITGLVNPLNYATQTTVIQNVYSQVNITEYYDNFYEIDVDTRMGGIAGTINTPNVKLKNTVTLEATYTAEYGVKKSDGTVLRGVTGATMSPVATYDAFNNGATVAQVKNSVEALAEDVYYQQPSRSYENTSSPKPRFELVSAQVSEFGGTFDFDQSVWTGTSGHPVLKGVPYNTRPENVIEIDSADDLIDVAKRINTGYLRFDVTLNINRDIDLGGTEWIGIGPDFYHAPYSLTINGNGHKITNLYSTKTTDFKGLVNYARILHAKDLTIEDPVISGKGGTNTGALAGYVQYYGTFENCHVTQSNKVSAQNSIVRGKTNVGGLIGNIMSFGHRTSIVNCSSTVNVNCFATAAETFFNAGGLVGMVYGGTVKDCYATGNVTADAYSGGGTYYVGALIGQIVRPAIIDGCFATGNVTSGSEASFIGAINSWARGTTLHQCVYTGSVKYTYAPVSGFVLRYGGLIARNNALNVQLENNVVLTPSVTFHKDSTKTNSRRLGTLFCSTGASKSLSGRTDTTSGYKAIKETAVYSNNFTIATNWSAEHGGSTNDYFINDTAKTTTVDKTKINTKEYWQNTIGFDFDGKWEWNENLNGGMPTLKYNAFNAPGLGDSAIEIADKNDLNTFRNLVNSGTNFSGKTVKLVADVDLGGTAWTPIGKDTATTFEGTFDGNGHTISNLNVNKASAFKGFFVYLKGGAVVKNLTLENPVIVSNAYANTGAVAGGLTNASIINCHVKGGSITSAANNTGGIVGKIEGTQPVLIAQCSVTSLDPETGYATPISGKSCTAGIVGYANITADLKAVIEDCYCTRPIYSLDNGYGIGGIAGSIQGTIIRRCYSSGSITVSRGSNIGGIVGTIDKYNSLTYKTQIYDCFSTGTIYSVGNYTKTSDGVYSCAGGIVGRNNLDGTRIERCYALGEIMSCVQATPDSGVTNVSRATSGGILGCSNQASTTVTINANISLSPSVISGNAVNRHNQVTSRFAITDSNTTAKVDSSNNNYYLDGAYLGPTVIRVDSNCQSYDSIGTAKPWDYFRNESLYTGIGWDMDEVWEMQDGVNDGLPYLKALGAPIYESGSVYNPIQINNKEEFKAFAANVNNAVNYDGQYVELNCNVDMSGIGRIGYDYKHAFSGHFDGKNHKLTNVSISASTNCVGVFGYVTCATIKNLTVDKPTIKQTGTGVTNAGGLIGYSLCNLTLENCAVTGGTVTSQGAYAGGLAGLVNHGYNRVTGCFSTAKVTGGARVGGLIGEIRNSSVERCYAVADVTGSLTSNYSSGGLIGRIIYGGSVKNCYAKGKINDSATASGAVAGGIVGEISAVEPTQPSIINCYFSGTLTAYTTAAATGTRGAYVGGIVGLANVKITVKNCAVLATDMSATATKAANARTGDLTNAASANAPTEDNNLKLSNVKKTTAKGTSFASQNISSTATLAAFTSDDTSVNKFRSTLGWNFNDIWTQSAGANDGLPMLMGLPVDNSDLESLLAAAKGYKAEDWNVPTFAVLTEAVADAEEYLASASSDEKDAIVKKLAEAIEGLRPETSSLQTLYDEIMTDKEPYKEWYTNFAAVENALAQANTILEEDSNKYKNKDVVTALANLMLANDNLQVDKTRLNEGIKKCSGVIESDYQPAEWATLQGELKNAVKVYGNPNATAFEVKTATEALEGAIAGLKADKRNLEKKLAAAYSALGGEVTFDGGVMTVEKQPVLTAEKFEKFDKFEAALDSAESVYAQEDALASSVISSAYNLGVALGNLVLDRTELRDEYNLASLKKEGQYSEESWTAFKTAFDNAGEVLQKPDATPEKLVEFSEEIDEALAALKTAVSGLAIDKSKLEELIEVAKEEIAHGEIYESLDDLEAALADAEAVVADPAATVSQISGAAIRLNEEILNLEINIKFLKDKVKEAQGYIDEKDEEYYTAGSMTALETAYTDAKVFVDKQTEGTLSKDDLDDVKAATLALTDALESMEANVARLRELIQTAKEFDDNKYDGDSVEALKELAEVNETMLDGGDYTGEQVIKGIKDLDYAFKTLRADKTKLSELVEEVAAWVNVKYRQDENGDWIVDENGNLKAFVIYSAESWDAMQAVLAVADGIVNKPNATVTEIEDAYNDLQQAIEALEIDLSELLDRITQANNILNGATQFTEDTTDALIAARNAAQAIADDVSDKTLDDVQTALDNLVAAIDGLEVDLTELNALIELCLQQQAEGRREYFTAASFNDLAAQTAFVQSILEKDDKLTEQENSDYIGLLTHALQSLEIDVQALTEAIERAAELKAEFITAATFAAVGSAVADAEALLSSGNLTDADYEVKLASVEDYAGCLDALIAALDGIEPDIAAFEAFIAKKNELTAEAYSSETLDELKAAINNANADLESAEMVVTYDAVITHVDAILTAIDGLIPDTSGLIGETERIIDEMHTEHVAPLPAEENEDGELVEPETDPLYMGKDMFTYEYYTEDSYKVLTDVIDEVHEFVKHPEGKTIEDVEAMQKKLTDAYEGLVIDKSALRELLDECSKLNEDFYTQETFGVLSAAIEAGESVYSDDEIALEAYVAAYNDLTEARHGLNYDTAGLDKLIERAEEIIAAAELSDGEDGKLYYTNGSLQKLKDALEDAATFDRNADSGEEDESEAASNLADLCKELSDAIDGLVDLSALREKIKEAQAIENDDGSYSEESFAALAAGIATAKEVYEEENPTAAQVAEQVEKLDGLIEGLTAPENNKFIVKDENTVYAIVDANGAVLDQAERAYDAENPAYLVNVALNDSVADIISQFTKTDIRAFKSDGTTEITDLADAKIATGIILRIYAGEQIADEITVVVRGDINGDGKLSSVDKALLTAYFTGTKTFNGAFRLSCDINGDGKYSSIDKAWLTAHFSGKRNLYDNLSVKEGE